MIDLHSHILPGLDDGARTMADALAIATAAAGDGVRVLAATPHVRGDFPTSAETMAQVLAEVRQAVSAAGIDLDVVPGGEIGLDRLPTLTPRELDRFGLAEILTRCSWSFPTRVGPSGSPSSCRHCSTPASALSWRIPSATRTSRTRRGGSPSPSRQACWSR